MGMSAGGGLRTLRSNGSQVRSMMEPHILTTSVSEGATAVTLGSDSFGNSGYLPNVAASITDTDNLFLMTKRYEASL